MFDDVNLGASVLKNPAVVQSMILTEFQNRLNGVYSVADPNTPFNVVLEAGSSINAQTVREMEHWFEQQYAVRATTSADLYGHMSDFDYLNMVANPASTSMALSFDVDYLVAAAQSYNASFNMVVIPANTQFTIGSLTFGIYYPINIMINKINNNISVLWDTTTSNPLHTLSTNQINFALYSTGGLNLIVLHIPVSQFTASTATYNAISQQGFIQPISYTDQFYAVRVWTNLPTGSWTELALTPSETVYDPTVPTAKFVIQNDIGQVTVTIPQIYFTNNQIGNQVMVTVYTTKGAITVDWTSVELQTANCSFNPTGSTPSQFSSILHNLSTIILQPAEAAVTGGSSAMSFTQLRNLVVNGGLYDGVPVTPAQLTAFAEKQGFSITKYIDNVTDRIYFASNTIEGGQNGVVMVTTSNVTITPSATSTTATILNFSAEQAVTILPTTLYTYNAQTNVCTPLTDTQVATLNGMTKAALATELNTNTYTKYPFHLVTYTASQYPVTKSFNLMNPTVNSVNFVADNVYLSPQMSVISAAVIHQNNGTGGFLLRLGVRKNPAMVAIAESNITVYVSAQDIEAETFYGIATLMGTTPDLFIYDLTIPTTYYISETGAFRSQMAVINQIETSTIDIELETTFTVTFLLNPTAAPGVAQVQSLMTNVPNPYSQLLAVSRQTLDIVFGTDLSQQVYNTTNATWSAQTYVTYPTNIYVTYPEDVYATDSNGVPLFTIIPPVSPSTQATVQLQKIHAKGQQVLDQNGNPIVQYAQGSVQNDATGNPIVQAGRTLQYTVSTMMFDLRLFYSQNQTDVTFVAELTSVLQAYFDTVTAMEQSLLEQTQLFYVPKQTMGTAVFSAGNSVQISLNLGFSFALVVYVSQATLSSAALQASMTATITSIIQAEMNNTIISLTDIADNIKTQLSTSVSSVDVDGIDNSTTLQTVIVPSGTLTPIVGQQLVYDVNADTLSLQSAITIAYKLAA